jgi:predicted CXXCH cytochrome family protein
VELAQQNGQLKAPADIFLNTPEIRFEGGVTLQCTSCHNPHRDQYGKFLVVPKSAICTSCHVQTGWTDSGHATNTSISAEGCGNCHVPHNAKTAKRLLKNTPIQQNCLNCHTDIQEQLSSTSYTHPVGDRPWIHDEGEKPLTAEKHVTCVDCHNPHQARSLSATPPLVNGSLLGVRGVTFQADLVKTSTNEYEICFRCHADNPFQGPQTIARQFPLSNKYNTRLQFLTSNASYHPVVGQKLTGSVPGMQQGHPSSSVIYCTDCHGNSDGPKGSGPGTRCLVRSGLRYLLLATYETEMYDPKNPAPYITNNFTLCWSCHVKEDLIDTTNDPSKTLFQQHKSHLDRGILCSICHDPHGVSVNPHLINFDTRFVDTNTPVPVYQGTTSTKSCTVSCHTTGSPDKFTHTYTSP